RRPQGGLVRGRRGAGLRHHRGGGGGLMARRKKGQQAPLYLVQRMVWCADFTQGRPVCRPEMEPEAWVPEAAFRDRDRAEEARRRLEAACCRDFSPFDFCYPEDLECITKLSERAFSGRLQKAGLEPPTPETFPGKYGGIDWHAWYDSIEDQI